MKRYRILAQSCFSSARIERTIEARSEAEAIRWVGPELHEAGYYVIDAQQINAMERSAMDAERRAIDEDVRRAEYAKRNPDAPSVMADHYWR